MVQSLKICTTYLNVKIGATLQNMTQLDMHTKYSSLVKTYRHILHDSTTKTQQREILLAYILVVLLFVGFVLKKTWLLTLLLGS